MFKFWKRKKNSEVSSDDPNPYLNAILSTGVERRRYVRVHYPPVGGIGDLPSVQYDGQFVEVINLSQGGLFLLSPPFGKALTGQEFKFRLHWPGRKLEVWNQAKLLRVQRTHWHFEFTQLDPRFVELLPGLVKTGLRGQNTKVLNENEIPSGENIIEVWMSQQGDFVFFQAPPQAQREKITLCYDGKRMGFDPTVGLVAQTKRDNRVEETPVSQETVDTVLIYLSNLERPTPRIQKLISGLVDRYYRSAATKVS